MIKLLIISSLLLPLSVFAGSIYKCKDITGKVVFSDKPCLTKKGSQEQLNRSKKLEEKETLGSKSKITNVNNVVLDKYDSVSITSYLDSLSFDKFSNVLPGLKKNSFHGINIEKLFQENNIKSEKWFKTDESLEYMIHMEKTFKLFSVAKNVFNSDANSHSFLDLSDREIINKLSSRGFGKPKDRFKEADYSWKWSINEIKCELRYRRNRFNPEKGFQYSCEKN